MTTPTSPDTRALALEEAAQLCEVDHFVAPTNEYQRGWNKAVSVQAEKLRLQAKMQPAITQPPALTDRRTPDTWRMAPPHFKPDVRWQRQPQSYEEWDAHQDTDRQFNAKRRLAFAGDLADPRAPECMALVSRLDISVVLGRLAWLEARFENTAASALPAPPIRSHEKETK